MDSKIACWCGACRKSHCKLRAEPACKRSVDSARGSPTDCCRRLCLRLFADHYPCDPRSDEQRAEGSRDLRAMGQFVNVPRYPPADYRGVSAPNADTLYSVAWLDLCANRRYSATPTWATGSILFAIVRSVDAGIRNPPRAAAPPAERLRITCSPVPAGKAMCRPE